MPKLPWYLIEAKKLGISTRDIMEQKIKNIRIAFRYMSPGEMDADYRDTGFTLMGYLKHHMKILKEWPNG